MQPGTLLRPTFSAVRRVLFTAALVLTASALSAQTTVTLVPSKDNTLIETAAGNLSNATGISIIAGRTNQGADFLRRALVAFDVAATVPAGATIQSATLTLDMTLTIAGNTQMSVHPVTADWGEGTSQDLGGGGRGVAATAGDATWTERFFGAGQPWATSGGDFVAAASSTTGVNGNGSYVWSSTAATVADVQSWLDTPSANFGWILIGDEVTMPSAKRFDSREGTAPPILAITYIGGVTAPGAAIPTADTWALGLLSLLLAIFAVRRISS